MAKNLGGKILLNIGTEVRYLNVYSCASAEVYIIETPHTDFRARATLRNGDDVVHTHYDRILPAITGGMTIAVLGDKEVTATCPVCQKVSVVVPNQTHLTCCDTLEIYFMSDAEKALATQEAQKFDLQTLTTTFEVWVKEGSKFNESTELTTVQLVLLEGESPRKMSFNLYNGQLSTSGKAVDLHLDEFKSGQVADGSKARWYTVDATKYHKTLTSGGYRKL